MMLYVGDGADIQNWMHAYLKIGKNNTFIDHYPLGSMGVGAISYWSGSC